MLPESNLEIESQVLVTAPSLDDQLLDATQQKYLYEV